MSDPREPASGEEPSWRSDLRDLINAERRTLQGHPDVDELLAYAEGRLTGEPAERLRDHLAICRECADFFLNLSAFEKALAVEDARTASNPRAEAAWWEFQSRLKEEEQIVPPSPPAEVTPFRREVRPAASRPFWHGRAMRLAAAVLVAAVGLGIWNLWSRPGAGVLETNQEVSEETRFLTFRPAEPEARGTQRGGAVGWRDREKELSVTQDEFLGLPLPEGALSYPAYRAEVVNAEGGPPLLTAEDLKLMPRVEGGSGQGFTVKLKRGALDPGEYTIRVDGVKTGALEPIAEYPFRMAE